MTLFSLIAGSLVPAAHASSIEQLGAEAPGISDMWGMLKSIFPHTDLGGRGVNFILLAITDFILRTIGAVAVMAIIYGGIKMITSGEEGLGEAKKILQYAIGGLIAAICADAIVGFALTILKSASGG
jgi:hypothetical protein